MTFPVRLASALRLTVLALSPVLLPAAPVMIYIGTYTTHGSQGIYAYRFDSNSGVATPLGLAAETASPSFLAMHPNGRLLYAVNEVSNFEGKKTGSVSAFAIEGTDGKLRFLNRVASGGTGPCHLAVAHDGSALVVANYGSGTVAAFPIAKDGSLQPASDVDAHSGKGFDPKRQTGPHAHSTVFSPDGTFLISDDLGLDKIYIYRPSPGPKLTPNNPAFTAVKGGSGPRHFAFAPNGRFGYGINELASTLTTYSWNASAGALTELQTVSTLPGDFSGENSTAEVVVHPNGHFVYGSNRGADTIAVFRIDSKTGKVTTAGATASGGKEPRSFAIDPTGKFLIAANQKSDNLVVFRVDSKSGQLTPTGATYQVGAPVCVLFAPGK